MNIDRAFAPVFAALIAATSSAHGALSLDFEDPLTSGQAVSGEAAKDVNGGTFTSQGWQSTSTSSQIRITLSTGFAPGESGALELDITNFDPVNQYSGDKHQFFNLYTRSDGSKADWENTAKGWWNVRGGKNYMTGDGAGFKFLLAPAGLDSRHEVRLIQDKNDWDTGRTYTLRAEWTSSEISLYLDGQKLTGPHDFGGRGEDLAYVFIGKDNVYGGFSGPVYTALRVYRDGPPTPNTPPTARAGSDQTVNDTDENGTESVSLDGSASSDGDGSITSYTWSEGGSQIATGATPTVDIPVGTHTITLTVTDDDGASDTDTVRVTVVSSNPPPVADAGADRTVSDDDLDDAADVTLDGTGSSDDGSIASYTWSEAGSQIATGVSPTVSLDVGAHTILLTVEDDKGAADTDTVVVMVLPQDDDADGMADTWEIDTFGSTSVADATSDFDADGWSDAQEYALGSDPLDGDSQPPTAAGGNGISCAAGGTRAEALPVAFALAALACAFGMRRRDGSRQCAVSAGDRT